MVERQRDLCSTTVLDALRPEALIEALQFGRLGSRNRVARAERGEPPRRDGTHGCMTSRGVKKDGVSMVTSCLLGEFRDNPDTRREFLSLVHGSR